ncbi:tetratricopeptide repeat protein [Anabaena sp. CCY 9402-a]|uniref:tetratricopeptide repeat protein n=1 Tax=Anabaena sp. CCY 9402-a TaxID=3103867 RepID=UPI0039C68D63
MLKRFSIIITAAIIWQFSSDLTLAQSKNPLQADKFPPSPLEITTPDPLLPNLRDKQPLSLLEKLKLQAALDELNQEAVVKLQAGDKEAAFEIWNRELRLRRYLGAVAEVQALSRVGEIAWNRSDRQQLYYITQRLQAIQKQAQPKKAKTQASVDLELLRALGAAYQKVRSPQPAIELYNQILAEVRQQKDTIAEIDTLQTLGNLNLSWFNYPQAATNYEELLSFATSRGERQDELTYLQQLAYIYQQAKQPQKSIDVLSKLKEIYSQNDNQIQVPNLQLAIAANYETLAKENPALLPEAFKNYQTAYVTAWGLQQYARAAEALQKLIPLYRSQGQINEALETSKILLETEARAANYYGMMQAYDQMGQLYLENKDYPQALTAFKDGLELAKQLQHQEAYFTQQVEKASQASL